MPSSVDSVHCKAISILSTPSRFAVKAVGVTGCFSAAVTSLPRNSGMPPGWCSSAVSPVASFLNVIFRPLWM